MDQFEELRRYNGQQRRQREELGQRKVNEQQRLARLSQEQQRAREQERRAIEQRHAQEQRAKQLEANERQRLNSEEQHARMQRISEELRSTEQQRREALNRAVAKLEEAKQGIRKSGDFIELPFWNEWKRIVDNPDFTPKIDLQREYHIGRYRVDFACVVAKVVIELDGHASHSTRKARTNDYQRQRFIEDQGWTFTRFTGSEVFADVSSCVEIAIARIRQRIE